MIRPASLAVVLSLACAAGILAQEPAPAPAPAPSVAQPVVETPGATPAPAPTAAPAPEPTPEVKAAENPNHDQLRALRDGITAAMNKRDVEGLITFLHPDVVFTTMNGDVARGHQGIRDYFAKMMEGPGKIVENVQVNFIPDDYTILSLDDRMGVCYGHTKDSYVLKGGQKMEINARWTATMIKEDGKWLLSGFHYSTNMFDNPILTAVQKTMMFVGMGCAVVGLLLGMMIGRKTASRR